MGHFARECRGGRPAQANYTYHTAQNNRNMYTGEVIDHYLDRPEDMTGVQTPIDPSNGLENALDTFDALSLEQKDEMIKRYEGKREDFPTA
jgi:hypothetical protein